MISIIGSPAQFSQQLLGGFLGNQETMVATPLYMTRTMESLLTVLSGLAPFALVFGLIGVLVAVVLGVRFDRRQQKKIWKVKNEVKSHLNT